ncbi:hypothetical protein LPJ81_002176 [Coemansia sp. IMI 209127]|nr:hypothetical protein LPJ81_002176 [Coemansia sp. IMI 209127]
MAISEMLEKQVIVLALANTKTFLSKLFIHHEPDKKWPLLDCRLLNDHLHVAHFKMEGIPTLCRRLRKDFYMVKPRPRGSSAN